MKNLFNCWVRKVRKVGKVSKVGGKRSEVSGQKVDGLLIISARHPRYAGFYISTPVQVFTFTIHHFREHSHYQYFQEKNA